MKNFKRAAAAVLGTGAIIAAVAGTAYAEKLSTDNYAGTPTISEERSLAEKQSFSEDCWRSPEWSIGDDIPGATYLGDGIYVSELPTYQEPLHQINVEDINTDELVVLNEQEAVVGEYRYVDTIYMDGIRALSEAETHTFWAFREVYYEPDNVQSIHLASMTIEASFTWDKSAGTVEVDKQTVKYGYERHVTSIPYPIIKETCIALEDNQGGFLGKKYAYVRYVLDVEKKQGEHDEWALQLEVDLNGTPSRKYK